MSASTNTMIDGYLAHLFHNVDFAGIGDTAGLRASAAAGSLYISLHTADPGLAGAQNASEANYTGYARVAVARTVAAWTKENNEVRNAAVVQFAACTAGGSTVTHVGIGTAASGAGKLLYRGPFTDPASITVAPGIAPKIDPDVLKVKGV